MKKFVFSLLALSFFIPAPVAADDLSNLPILNLADVINALEDRCPCVDILESPEEELREEQSPLDELENLTNDRCLLRITSGRHRQAFRYFRDLGLFQLQDGETLRDSSSVFKEGRRDCRSNSNGNPGGGPRN